MNNKELFHNISNITEADKELLKELQVQLDEELNKPIKQQDFDLIEEITKTICEIHNENELIEAKTKSGIAFLKGRKSDVNNKLKIRKWSAVFVSCVAVILALNIASFSALGMNMFSAAYKIVKGGITIDMNEGENLAQFIHHELFHLLDDKLAFDATIREDAMYSEEEWSKLNQ